MMLQKNFREQLITLKIRCKTVSLHWDNTFQPFLFNRWLDEGTTTGEQEWEALLGDAEGDSSRLNVEELWLLPDSNGLAELLDSIYNTPLVLSDFVLHPPFNYHLVPEKNLLFNAQYEPSKINASFQVALQNSIKFMCPKSLICQRTKSELKWCTINYWFISF